MTRNERILFANVYNIRLRFNDNSNNYIIIIRRRIRIKKRLMEVKKTTKI